MFLKIFRVTVVVLLAIISMVLLAFLLTGLISMIESSMLSGSSGIILVAGGVSARLFTFFVLAAATVLVCGIYLFWRRRRKLHR